jgi:hypothetical protein
VPRQCLRLSCAVRDNGQQALSTWFYNKYRRPASERCYATAISIAIKVGGVVVGATVKDSSVVVTAGALPEVIPKRILGMSAKLLVQIYDTARRELDPDRSYSIEIMQSRAEYTREDVAALLARFAEAGENSHATRADTLADLNREVA